jgi:hypothetical protein
MSGTCRVLVSFKFNESTAASAVTRTGKNERRKNYYHGNGGISIPLLTHAFYAFLPTEKAACTPVFWTQHSGTSISQDSQLHFQFSMTGRDTCSRGRKFNSL